MPRVAAPADPPPPPSSLVPTETAVDFYDFDATAADPAETIHPHPFPHLHCRHNRDRDRIIAALATSTYEPLRKRATRISACMLSPWIREARDGTIHMTPGRCNDRACPTCQVQRSRVLARNVTGVVQKWNDVRHVVLTLNGDPRSLKESLDLLTSSYRRLRQTTLWKEHVDAAIATIEVTHNAESGRWHPHLHVLTDGRYLDVNDLRKAWEKASHGAKVVWIERIPARDKVTAYIAKYTSKSPSAEGWSDATIREWTYATHGRRTVICSGTCKSIRMKERDPEHDHGPSQSVTSLHALKAALQAQLIPAKIALDCFRDTHPYIARACDPDGTYDTTLPPDAPLNATLPLATILRDIDDWYLEQRLPARWSPDTHPPPTPPPTLF